MYIYVLKWKYHGKITIYNTTYGTADLLTAVAQLERDFTVMGEEIELISFDLQDT